MREPEQIREEMKEKESLICDFSTWSTWARSRSPLVSTARAKQRKAPMEGMEKKNNLMREEESPSYGI